MCLKDLGFSCGVWCSATGVPVTPDLWICWFGLVSNEMLQSLSPTDPKLGPRPSVGLRQEKLFQLPLNCDKLKSVSCTSNLLAQMCDFPKMHKSPQNLPQNQNLETILICFVVLYHMTIMSEFACVMNARDETRETIITRASVHVGTARASLFTDHKTIYQYEPNKDISEQFVQPVDKFPTAPISSSLDWWSSMHSLTIFGLYSTRMSDWQGYCGQLQKHVRIQNVCWSCGKTFRNPSFRKSCCEHYFFMVPRYGRSCQEMREAILWVGQQDNSTTLQSIDSMMLVSLFFEAAHCMSSEAIDNL